MARYTTLDLSDVRRLCAEYRLNVRGVTALNGGMANSSYLVACAEGDHVLTVLDNHDLESARALAALLERLHAAGARTPPPLVTAAGGRVLTYEGRPVIVKPYVEGRCHDVLPEEHLASVGAALSCLHRLPVDGFPGLPLRGRRLPADWRARAAAFGDRDFAGWLDATHAAVESFTSRRCEPVVVHGDLFSDNVVVAPGGRLVILDWETASLDDPLTDLGMAIVGLCRVDGSFRPERASMLAAGYAGTHGLARLRMDLLQDATVHAALVIAYHRYVRHHLTHPDPANQHFYREIPPFVEQLLGEWEKVSLLLPEESARR